MTTPSWKRYPPTPGSDPGAEPTWEQPQTAPAQAGVEPTNEELARGGTVTKPPLGRAVTRPPRNEGRVAVATGVGLLGVVMCATGLTSVFHESNAIGRDAIAFRDGTARVAMTAGEERGIVESGGPDVGGAACEISGPGGEAVALRPGSFSSQSGSRHSVLLGSFTSESAGQYTVTCRNATGTVTLARVPDGGLFAGGILGIVFGFMLVIGGPLVIMLVPWRRRPSVA